MSALARSSRQRCDRRVSLRKRGLGEPGELQGVRCAASAEDIEVTSLVDEVALRQPAVLVLSGLSRIEAFIKVERSGATSFFNENVVVW